MYTKAAHALKQARDAIAFTGAGISVESGIPPFRGENGLWNKYDPAAFDIQFFFDYPRQSWEVIREIFYELFGRVRPNPAHYALAELELSHRLKCIITQNIDHLHQEAGSRTVHEFHGSLKTLVCLDCRQQYTIHDIDLNILPPRCNACSGIIKPDIIFFGEAIPEPAATCAMNAAQKADCMILIGTTGTVAPANMLPGMAKSNGAMIIEINPEPSEYTERITDIFIEEKAGPAMENLLQAMEESADL